MGERRPRRTAAAVERAVLDAAFDELRKHGYARVTFEGVARRAGTSKPVVYRRYSTRATLVLAALRAYFTDTAPAPCTGTLRTDLIACLEAAQARAAQVGEETYRALLGEADAELLDALAALIEGATADLERDIIAPARARGELGPNPLPADVLALPAIMLRDRVLFGRTTGNEAAEIVDRVCLPVFRECSGLRPRP
ncbi:TetR/AcrR family transcriptional regulator [Streptomyces sp. NBC_01352]|uniref:TetR/AcrR family transcriptional regulator n=1 Tax=Streptomyces sp. NBC_01352 TaxID=2903834 RepID=UPI002E36D82A|nr:TetR/AcrR family transcriptional regulator [Streptomyces sp. NBC_01352]